ncbi:hypothetical protein K437DRAFT_2431 [Tilletiaria anomala UBC 951]|uniref:Uncharacterized protein n=1 Tax=Tilletiaria anomala (strain ATCC 24038 / CBS 436.72 / UBC 951) TaxID=1037660 RepID=A0A066WSA6_TILAU|nr:uncharacterized protein K437DRAFT_2431 [Tilletiaria anomala UBC 951]KDN53575.1 hypothetical protein K437DRAFT_2431 [Tilletiaria anomala UBC 951]
MLAKGQRQRPSPRPVTMGEQARAVHRHLRRGKRLARRAPMMTIEPQAQARKTRMQQRKANMCVMGRPAGTSGRGTALLISSLEHWLMTEGAKDLQGRVRGKLASSCVWQLVCCALHSHCRTFHVDAFCHLSLTFIEARSADIAFAAKPGAFCIHSSDRRRELGRRPLPPTRRQPIQLDRAITQVHVAVRHW